MKLKIFGVISLILSLCSCDMFEYHPLHHKAYMLDAKNLNFKNRLHMEFNEEKDTLSFVFMGDTHNDYKITKEFVNHINNKEGEIDFVIHAGDISDFGLRKEYQKFHEIFSKLACPYFVLIGNHDMLEFGDDLYREMFGDTNFAFSFYNGYGHGSTGLYGFSGLKFICLNTNMLCGNEYDYFVDYAASFKGGYSPVYVDDTVHYEQDRVIFLMHSPPYCEQFKDEAVIKRLGEVLDNSEDEVMFCLHGHQHKYSENDFYNNGIMFYGCDNIAKRTYLHFKITKEGYTYELVTF